MARREYWYILEKEEYSVRLIDGGVLCGGESRYAGNMAT
jgi:hypothetical protein